MVSLIQRRLIRTAVCALLLALAAVGDRITAQTALLPNYLETKEGQIWQYAGHIGAPMDPICRQDYDACPPPLASQLFEPTGFAVFQPGDLSTYRLLIADRINERLSVFGWQTSLTGTGTPHGQFIETVETFASPVDTDGNGSPNTRLSVPESVSVDSVGNVIIADSGNSRLLVLDATYQYRFEISYGTPAQVSAFENPFPYYLAITPGTVIQPPGVCNPATPGPGRILVGNTSPIGAADVDGQNPDYMNQIVVYDGAFCELSRIGTASLLGSSAPGEFKGFNGLTFDDAGRLFVGDYGNARVQAFVPIGLTNPADPFSFIGFDPSPVLIVDDPAPTNLPIEPWGVMIDARNRLVIAQPNQERVSVFNLDWDGPGPIATPAFALTAQQQIQGAPHHVGIDGMGRWLVSTPSTDKIDVFITPELAVIDQSAVPVDTDANGTADSIRVEFSVVTPVGKTARPNVNPFAEAVPSQVGLGTPTGPFPSPLPGGGGDFPAAGTDIDPGKYARWYFLFPITDGSLTNATFNVWATSGGGSDPLVTAPAKTVKTRISTCASTGDTTLSSVKIFDVNDLSKIAPLGPGGNSVYGPYSEVRISASDADGVASTQYQFTTSLSPVETLGNQVSFTIPNAGESGTHSIEYWAIDNCNVVAARRQIDLYVDFEAPRLAYNAPDQPSTGTDHLGTRWWNAPVTMQVDATDDDTFNTNVVFLSGNVLLLPQGPTLSFSAEGLLQNQLVRVADPVGNEYEEYSHVLGGEYVNIDLTRPTVTLAAQTSPVNGWYSGDVSFLIEGKDALSGIRTLTSSASLPATTLVGPNRSVVQGTSTLTGEGSAVSISVSATDQAGNSALTAATATVKIDRTAPVITATPMGTSVGGVYQHSVAVTLSASDVLSGLQSLYYSINGGTEVLVSGASVSLGPFTQNTTISVRAVDVAGNQRVTPLTYAVNAVNAPPVAVSDSVSSNGAATFTIPASALLGNDTDSNADTLTISGVTDGAAGTVILNANGSVTYTRTNLTAASDVFTYTVSDGHGGTSTATVTVLLNRPPDCSAAKANPPEIWPPNHKKQYNVNVTGVTDPDGNPFTITITGIFQDEPVDTTGDGQFSPDGGGVGTSTAWVRAERMGGGNGRVYEIRFKATDSNGGSCLGSVYTTVPKSRGQARHAIDDGHRYDSTAVVPGTKDKNQTHKNK